MAARCDRWFLLQVSLFAQHVSGTTMPIIRSSRVLYRWLLLVVFGALVSKLSVWCGAEGYVSGLRAAVASSWHFTSTSYLYNKFPNFLCFVDPAALYNLANKTNLVHNLFLVYLSISTGFGRLCAHHQEKQLFLCDTWYLFSVWMNLSYAVHTRQSSIQKNKYQVLHKHSCFSWWWAHSRPKHVEIDKYKFSILLKLLIPRFHSLIYFSPEEAGRRFIGNFVTYIPYFPAHKTHRDFFC